MGEFSLHTRTVHLIGLPSSADSSLCGHWNVVSSGSGTGRAWWSNTNSIQCVEEVSEDHFQIIHGQPLDCVFWNGICWVGGAQCLVWDSKTNSIHRAELNTCCVFYLQLYMFGHNAKIMKPIEWMAELLSLPIWWIWFILSKGECMVEW